MSEMGSEDLGPGLRVERKLVMLAVDASPESKGAVLWATRSMINPGDEVLVFHAIKAMKEIPTAMGMVPFSGANPEMQRAHTQVTEENARKMVSTHVNYCKTQKIEPKTEVVWGQRRDAILKRVVEGGVTHLVMGTGKSNRRLSFLRKESLTAAIARDAQCQVFLVGKNAKLASRSSYNSDASTRLINASSAPERLMDDLSALSRASSVPAPGSARGSASLSTTSSGHYPGSESDESETPLGSPHPPPLFRATATPPKTPDLPRSPASVLGRGSPLQRSVSGTSSPLAGGANLTPGVANSTLQRANRTPPRRPVEMPLSGLEATSPYRGGLEPGSFPRPVCLLRPRSSPGVGPMIGNDDVTMITSSFAGGPSSRPGSARVFGRAIREDSRDDVRDDGKHDVRDDRKYDVRDDGKQDVRDDGKHDVRDDDGDDVSEIEQLRLQVAQLRLVSEMRAREAARYAEALDANQSETDAITRQLVEESKRRQAAERTASRLVSVLGETAPDKIVDIMNAGMNERRN